MKSLVLFVSLFISLSASSHAQQPFGVDAESLYQPLCNHTYGCPELDEAAAAGAQWIRLFAVWANLQPTAGSALVVGELPYQIWYAQQKGMNVTLTATWAPQWANGATSTCPPYAGATQTGPGTSTLSACAHGYGDVGRTVTSPSFTQQFFYELTLQFNGSSTAGCASNSSTCHPLVQYFGAWNEPNGMNNFNDTYFDGNNLGNYLNDFVGEYLQPAYYGAQSGNPSAHIMAAELGTGGNSCGGFSGCGTWQSSWMSPLSAHYSQYYSVITIHGYNSSESVLKGNVDQVQNSYNPGSKPIWVDENAMSGTNNVTLYYIDEHNRQSYWPVAFWELGGYGVNCSTTTYLLCSVSGATTLSTTPYFSAYQAVYAPH